MELNLAAEVSFWWQRETFVDGRLSNNLFGCSALA
jgi:hypothetical protein